MMISRLGGFVNIFCFGKRSFRKELCPFYKFIIKTAHDNLLKESPVLLLAISAVRPPPDADGQTPYHIRRFRNSENGLHG